LRFRWCSQGARLLNGLLQRLHDRRCRVLRSRIGGTHAQRFERRYLKDDDLFQELNEIEDELIDDYVSGALSAERRAAFEKHFLRSSERREKVEFAGAITERANLWKKMQAPGIVSLESGADERTSEARASTQTEAKILPMKRRHVPAWGQWAAIAAAVLFY